MAEAVIGQQFARILRVNSIGKTTRQFEIRCRGFAPYQIGIRGIRRTAADRLLNARMGAVGKNLRWCVRR